MTTHVENEATAATPDLATFREHWQDESDASYLYGILARLEKDPRRADVFGRLRDIETEHAAIWSRLLTSNGRPPGEFRPSARARLLAFLGQRFGTGSLVSLLLKEEGREVREYLTMHRDTPPRAAGRAEALQLAKESAEHATELAHLAGVAEDGEPWHRVESGGFLRNVVYGFNDGLTANFGLVAGVLGATATQQHEAVVVAGAAGVIADALSMGSSGYLAAKSEQEVHAHEIAMERDEIAYMPERRIPRPVNTERAAPTRKCIAIATANDVTIAGVPRMMKNGNTGSSAPIAVAVPVIHASRIGDADGALMPNSACTFSCSIRSGSFSASSASARAVSGFIPFVS